MYQRLLNEWLKTEEGATLFNKHKRDIDLLSGFASWLESRPTKRAADLPKAEACPHGWANKEKCVQCEAAESANR